MVKVVKNGSRQVLKNNYVQYELRGVVNGKSGVYQLGVKPSPSGRTEVIVHRFFKPDR